MKLRLPISKSKHFTFISADAATLTSSHDVTEEFYGNLVHAIKTAPQSDKLVLLGYFNAGVGRDHSSWAGVLGKYEVGKAKDNGLLLISKCADHNLCIIDSLFRMVDKYKATWVHPGSEHMHVIDFVGATSGT